MSFYIASKSQVVARKWKEILESEGYDIVARWIDEYDFGSGPPYDDIKRSENAVADEEDIRAADALIFRSEPDGVRVAGGKHVETGIAIALHKQVYVIGPKENIFHWHPLVKIFDTFDDFTKYILIMEKKMTGIKKDKNDHIWIKRNKSVAPFRCKNCGALSGSDKAFEKCPNKRSDSSVDFLEEQTKHWLAFNFEKASQFSFTKGISYREAVFYLAGMEHGANDYTKKQIQKERDDLISQLEKINEELSDL